MRTLKLALLGITAVLVVGNRAQLPNLDNVGDILQSLKDSGMMDKFEKDLKQMMFEQKPVESRDSDTDSDSTSSESEPPVDVYEFIKAYVTEKKIKLNEKVTLYLMELPIKDDLHVHLARLTGVLDKIGEITKLNKKQVDNKVVETVKRIKSLSVMKTSLDKLYTEAATPENTVETKAEPKAVKTESKVEAKKVEKKEQPKKVKKTTDDDITGALTTFLEMIKARPEQMINVLTTAMSAYNLVSPQTLKTVDMYVKMMAKTEYFNTIMDVLINSSEGLGETEFGRHVIEFAPLLMQASSVGEAIEILSKEFDLSQNGVMAMVQDPETKGKAVTIIATVLTSGINVAQNFIKDDMKMTFVNTFLLAQGFPSINSRKIVQSATKLVDKLISIFTPWDYELKQHEKSINEFVKNFEDTYVTWPEYHKMEVSEQIQIMSKFLTENLGEPAALLWTAHQAISQKPECSESVICNLNHHIKSTESKLKLAMTRGLSMLASWAWNMEGKVDYGKLYEAIWTADCDKKYPQTAKRSCDIFPWQSSLNIEHIEL